MTLLPFLPDDLSPGDQRFRSLDFSRVCAQRIASLEDPLLRRGYDRLWQEFGHQGEMETLEVIVSRLRWFPAAQIQGRWLRYDLVVMTSGEDLVGVADHVAIASETPSGPRVVVHQSHILVEPAWRRRGVAAWMRSMPLQTGRACLEAAGLPLHSPVTLVAEVEHPDTKDEAKTLRLCSFQRAGFLKVDPRFVDYQQPDFRPFSDIDAEGRIHPLPLALVLRRVGRESESSVTSEELRQTVECLYNIYGQSCRAQDMEGLWEQAARVSQGPERIPLIPPTGQAFDCP